MTEILVLLISIAVIVCFILIAVAVYKKITLSEKVKNAEVTALKLMDDAKRNAEDIRREAIIEAKDETIKARKEFEEEFKQRRSELTSIEKRLMSREEHLDSRESEFFKKEKVLEEKLVEVKELKNKLDHLYQSQLVELEKISGMTREEAKEHLLVHIEREVKKEAALLIREVETQAKQTAQKKAREIVSNAIQRCAVDHVVDSTTSVVNLPNDDMKGRIIGREGRNIRSFETLTGIDLVVDDTPETVVLSGFDPIRRETARICLEKLVADGRIHPSRIEEVHQYATNEMQNRILDKGEEVVMDVDVQGLHPKLVELLGRLQFRTSYGQNVLQHSIEVAHIASLMAQELGVNVKLARRAGLLHDIGKAIDFEMEGTHQQLGADLAKKYGESEEVVHAIFAHHEDVPPNTVEAILVLVADAISASRPGARKESLDAYIKRLEKLEGIANSFDGVDKSFAIQAGREVRIMVKPDLLDDGASVKLARDVAKKIERELEYPGQIKVSVIRESRHMEYAK